MSNQELAEIIITAFKSGHFLFLCGNGGSNDLACHMEEEFLCKFKYSRKPLPALALKPLTSISNDFGYDQVFARQIKAYSRPRDVLVAFSTSGKSENVNKAIVQANHDGMLVIEFPRRGDTTAEIQENQLKDMHEICGIVEEAFI